MHTHIGDVRTTVELSDDIRARLLELAARRGERGFSGLVEEAVARYLDEEERRRERVERARAVVGAMDEEDGRELERSVTSLRERWR